MDSANSATIAASVDAKIRWSSAEDSNQGEDTITNKIEVPVQAYHYVGDDIKDAGQRQKPSHVTCKQSFSTVTQNSQEIYQ